MCYLLINTNCNSWQTAKIKHFGTSCYWKRIKFGVVTVTLLCIELSHTTSWVPYLHFLHNNTHDWHLCASLYSEMQQTMHICIKLTWIQNFHKSMQTIEAGENLFSSILKAENELQSSRTSNYRMNVFDLVENVQSSFMHILICAHVWNGILTHFTYSIWACILM